MDEANISLTYRGVLIHRGVGISRESYGKTWPLRLANDVWTLTDHNGNEVHAFTQKSLHSKVALPGSLPVNKDLWLVGLGPQIYCFEPDQEVLDALKPYVEQSERANAPQLARWHRVVGLGFLGFGVLCLAACLAAVFSMILCGDVPSFLMLNLAMVLILPGLGVGGYFVCVGVRYWLKANDFSKMTEETHLPDS